MAYTYDYDADGNITAEYIYTDGATGPSSQTTINVYTYSDSNWKNKLTAYKGQAITYDQIGNPLTYRDGITMTWQNGRQLATLSQGENSISYKYDSNSVRTSKNVNGVDHTYTYLNGKLMYETRGNAKFYYSYDANGTLYSVNYTLTDSSTMQTYYYTHNAQGDIIGIYDSTGTLVAKYTYGDWGNVLSVTDANGTAITDVNHIANLNPFRYRSYYYDSETDFYYLMSRYYDPVTHRFLNADEFDVISADQNSLTDKNLFAYCDNNAIIRIDDNGDFWHIVAGAVVGGLISGAIKATTNFISGKPLTEGLGTAVLTGAISGAFSATTFGIGTQIAVNAGCSAFENIVGQCQDIATGRVKEFDFIDLAIDTTIGAVTGATGGAGDGSKHLTNLGIQTVKRTSNVVKHNGVKAGLKEVSKVASYYVKNTKSYYKTFVKKAFKDSVKSYLTVSVSQCIKNFFK